MTRVRAYNSAVTHPAHVEPVVPAHVAALLYAAGYRFAALAGTDGHLATSCVRVLTAADIRIGEALDRPGALDAVRTELRRIIGAAMTAPFDPEHAAAVRAETERCARQMGGSGRPEATE